MVGMNYQVRRIDYTPDVRAFVTAHHYTAATSLVAEHVFGLFDDDRLLGVAIFSQFSRQQVRWRYPGYVELSRFLVKEECPKNSESFFLSRCLKWLKQNTKFVGVLTYADPAQGHRGTIYKACNFQAAGETRDSYHYIDPHGLRLHKRNIWRQSRKLGISEKTYSRRLGLQRVSEAPKLRFLYAFRPSPQGEVQGEIYLVTNDRNDKAYVGSTINGHEYRWKRHCADARNGSPLPFHEAIRKIGPEHFQVRVIDRAKTFLELKNREAFHIAAYKSKPGGLYNVSEGYDHDSYLIPDAIFFQSLDMRAAGKGVQEIATELRINSDYLGRIHSGAVRPHIRAEWERKNTFDFYRFFSDKVKLEMFADHQAGLQVSEIAKKHYTSRHYVRGLLTGKISPEVLARWVETNPAPVLVNTRLKPREVIFQVYERVFVNGERPTTVAQDLGVVNIHRVLKGKLYGEYFAEWKKLKKPTKYSKGVVLEDSVLWAAFEERAKGTPIKEIAARTGLSLGLLNQTFLGKHRPNLLKRWLRAGGIPLTQQSVGKEVVNKVAIETSDGLSFASIKAAADHYEVSSQAIIKGIKQGRAVKGVKFARVVLNKGDSS